MQRLRKPERATPNNMKGYMDVNEHDRLVYPTLHSDK